MKELYVVNCCRTAIGSFGGSLKDVPAAQMGAIVVKAALERATSLDSLEREIESVSASIRSAGGTYTGARREESIYDAVLALSRAIRSDNLSGVDTRQSALGSLVFRRDVSDATEDYLQELEANYRALLSSAAGDTDAITASESGTFSSLLDGFESVGPEDITEMTPDDLREILAADREADAGALGKLIRSYAWYYAAIVDEEDADRLEEGGTVTLSFGRYYSGDLTADVIHVGEAEDGERLVLFRVDKGLAAMLAVRAVSAELIYSEYTGLRVPLRSLYRYYAGYMSDEDGQRLTEGQTVTLTLSGVSYEAVVSEVGYARRYGDLPNGVEAGSELDNRPTRRLVVFCWPWSASEVAPNFSTGGGRVTLPDGRTALNVLNYYDYDPEIDRLCVFTMTGLQAERKKVELVYAGDEYCLLRSEGEDALREGNEVIVQASNLHDGKVFR